MVTKMLVNGLFIFIWSFGTWRYLGLKSGQSLSKSQIVCFLTGSLVWLFSVCDPLASLSTRSLSIHVLNILLIMMVAGPLLVLGAPKLKFTQNRIFKLFQHPILSWAIFVAMLIFLYTPSAIGFAYQNPTFFKLIQAIVLPIISAIYFYPILQKQQSNFPYALRIMSLFFMMIPETMIGFFIYIQNHIVYPAFLNMGDTAALLEKQQFAGALMWSISMVVDVIWIAIAVHKWFDSEKEKGEKIKFEILEDIKSGKIITD